MIVISEGQIAGNPFLPDDRWLVGLGPNRAFFLEF